MLISNMITNQFLYNLFLIFVGIDEKSREQFIKNKIYFIVEFNL